MFLILEVIGGNEFNCTCYLKDAYVNIFSFTLLLILKKFQHDRLVWFSDKPIEWQSYTKEFDNYTKEKYDSNPDAPNRPDLVSSI